MRRKPPPESLTKKRTAQRRHAKRRFHERFDLQLNRDDIRAVENKIRDGRAVCTGRTIPGRSRWLVEVQGRLILVAYDSASQRVVTALPDDELQKVPPDVLRSARLSLLPAVQEQVIRQINEGRWETVWIRNEDVSFHTIEYDGASFQVGYRRSTGRLIRYQRGPKARQDKAALTDPPLPPHDKIFQRLQLPEELADSFREQIRTGQSRFLWRYSGSLAFHEVDQGGEYVRVGYNKDRQRFYAWHDPPDTMPELQSSLRLFEQHPDVIAAIRDMARTGRAALIEARDEHTGVYSAEWNGEQYFFMYSDVRDEIGIYVPRRRSPPPKR